MATYTIHCARGLTKYECPHFKQGELVCVECPYARYRLRTEADKNQPKTDEESND